MHGTHCIIATIWSVLSLLIVLLMIYASTEPPTKKLREKWEREWKP